MLPCHLLPHKPAPLAVGFVTSKPCTRNLTQMVQAVAAPMAPPAPAVSLRVITAADLSQQELDELTARPRINFTSILDTVQHLRLVQTCQTSPSVLQRNHCGMMQYQQIVECKKRLPAICL